MVVGKIHHACMQFSTEGVQRDVTCGTRTFKAEVLSPGQKSCFGCSEEYSFPNSTSRDSDQQPAKKAAKTVGKSRAVSVLYAKGMLSAMLEISDH